MPKPSPSSSPTVVGSVLPYDSTVIFVLDDPISSKSSKSGQIVRAHLKSAIVVAGRVVAPAGAPGQIRIVDSSAADIMDVYGFVDIFFEPLALPDGRLLPLRAPVGRLAPHVSSGHETTVQAEDTAGDIFVPYYAFWQILRKGKNFVLGPGSEVPARTEATITAQPNGTIAIVTPRPMPQSAEIPSSVFPVQPLATPIGATPKPTP
jgi:hypothetical protein